MLGRSEGARTTMNQMTGLPVSRRVMNLAGFLAQTARRLPDHLAIAWGDRRWSWREFEGRCAALAASLTAHGIGKGDRILVHARNGNELLETMFAAFRLGAVWVPTNVRLVPEEVAFLAEASGARAFLCQSVFPGHAAAVAAVLPDLRLLASIGEAGFGQATHEGLIAAGQGRPSPVATVEYDEPCWFFFTSGTTGRPKAAVLTHGQMGFVITNHLADLLPGTTEADASLVVAPLSHGAGIHWLTQVARGAASILMPGERFDAAEAWRLVEAHRVSNMFTVPTILKMLVEHPAVDAHDHASLRHVIYAGAPMYREDQKHALRKLGRVLVQYFGLGEVTGNITVLPPALHEPDDGPHARSGTCGYARTGMEIEIQDEQGGALPPGAQGEICVSGPAVFAGYWNNPEANAKAFRNGWFRTGDLGHMDAEGFLTITGRASDMYISGGSNVYPREVEEVILQYPGIAEVAVVGVPDRHWGEIGIAVIVPRAGAAVDEAGLLAWLDGRVARYKLPRRVFVWEALPRSGYGKITKAMVRAEMEARGLLPPA
ncbi:Acyl-CoA synthetase (AMP-forming)/AMP-acid ligase II [Belnapia rosea]|uniref:Acyl-CoA synthetase (AMP-forming)/AMP-acid ligase II n=2 Tax=Belnapia rosea TaxID=938405 RepID=A0A1G6J6Y4_9PROT|nr:Acyl-CoA synthetase (AMP-forming)/AMP-acid ligase II [Belnapia rosea]